MTLLVLLLGRFLETSLHSSQARPINDAPSNNHEITWCTIKKRLAKSMSQNEMYYICFNTAHSQFVKPNIVYVFTYVQSWCIYLICYFIVPSKLLQTHSTLLEWRAISYIRCAELFILSRFTLFATPHLSARQSVFKLPWFRARVAVWCSSVV